MAKYMSMEHLRYLLYDVHDVEQLFQYERFADYDKDSVNMLLNAVKSYSDNVLYPPFAEMDAKGAYFEDGKIIVHELVGQAMKDAGENGWLGSTFDYDHGGMQLPHTVANSLFHVMESANNHIPGYLGLTSGAADLIRTFGSKEQFDTYGPKMMAGEWAGTMCLTEPQAGSSLSDITTTAVPQADGSYKMKGQKIFISGGDHEYCDNFIHLTIARIEGAPAGTKGISLFIVPKKKLTEDGSLADNDVITAGDFQKMGQKSYCTAHLIFGEQDNCTGYLVGEANKGLKYMFQMMNGARIDVGLSATSTAMAAYYASLQYANERPQGRLVSDSGKKNVAEEQTLIINHPDVRRMLLHQKAITEGALSLLIECSKYSDLAHVAEGDLKENSALLLDILVPIAKTYPSEKGQESISNGLQVLGGYGFTSEYILQQYYRDIRIMSLYEGTTGIQSIDLLGRKVPMAKGKALMLLTQRIQEIIAEAKGYDSLRMYGEKLEKAIGTVADTLSFLQPLAMAGKYNQYLADATIFMRMTSTLVIAYQWLKMANVSIVKLADGNNSAKVDFYNSKIQTMKYFFKYELPTIKADSIILKNDDRMTIDDEILKVF